jgi:hypothetical protein
MAAYLQFDPRRKEVQKVWERKTRHVSCLALLFVYLPFAALQVRPNQVFFYFPLPKREVLPACSPPNDSLTRKKKGIFVSMPPLRTPFVE